MPPRVGLTYRYPQKADPYRKALALVGLELVDVTPETPRDSMDGLDGLVLSGGTDIDPRRYGCQGGGEYDDARDEMESQLLADALRRDLPVLGICRGLQLMNVALGGTLVRDMKHPDVHDVRIEPGSLLAEAASSTGYEVNSRHHQAADRVATDLRVVARAADGIVEGLEMPGKRFVVAVQWHPEDRVEESAADRALLAAFGRAVRR